MRVLSEKPKRKLSPAQQIITNLVDKTQYGIKGFWPREMKIAAKLLTEYKQEFLLWVSPPYGKKVPSLAYFIADYGKDYLAKEAGSQQYQYFLRASTDLSSKVETIHLEKDKIGEDVLVQKKPKTLQDFLNLYQ